MDPSDVQFHLLVDCYLVQFGDLGQLNSSDMYRTLLCFAT